MRTKQASILDFLSLPQKVTPTMYELFAKEAADAYIKEQKAPNTTIAKMASDKGLNPEQIHRVAELANHQINATMTKSASDQLFTFPVATVAGVLAEMGGKTAEADTEMDKVAEDVDFGIYDRIDSIPNYTSILSKKKFEQKLASMPKEASTGEEGWSWDKAPAAAQRNHYNTLQKKASADAEYFELEVRAAISDVRQEWEKLASDDDKVEFLYAGASVLGIPGVARLTEAFGPDAAKLASELNEGYLAMVQPNIDSAHPLVHQFQALRSKVETYGEAKQKVATVADAVGKARKFLGNPLRKSLVLGTLGATLAPKVVDVTPVEGAKAGVKLGLTPTWLAPAMHAKNKITGAISELQTGGN